MVCYSMNSRTRGLCVIFSNEDFPDAKREGTKVDVISLTKTFKWLDFDIKINEDMTAEMMHTELKKIAKMDHSSYDAFVCCILSHGTENVVYGVDMKPVTIDEVRENFKGNRCKTLVAKPKLFFIQACRGSDYDIGCRVTSNVHRPNVKATNYQEQEQHQVKLSQGPLVGQGSLQSTNQKFPLGEAVPTRWQGQEHLKEREPANNRFDHNVPSLSIFISIPLFIGTVLGSIFDSVNWQVNHEYTG